MGLLFLSLSKGWDFHSVTDELNSNLETEMQSQMHKYYKKYTPLSQL